jgi:hypothetical protein
MHEKEALRVLNEILAKVNPREKLIGIGAIVFLVGWLIGLLLATYGSGLFSGNVFNEEGGTGIGFLGVLGAIAAIGVIYVKYTPSIKITWPAPIPVVLLAIAAVVGIVALYLLWTNFSRFQDWGKLSWSLDASSYPGWPITDWIAVLGVVAGAVIMCWGAYQEWTLSKAA